MPGGCLASCPPFTSASEARGRPLFCLPASVSFQKGLPGSLLVEKPWPGLACQFSPEPVQELLCCGEAQLPGLSQCPGIIGDPQAPTTDIPLRSCELCLS